ncbi:MAG: amidohydrolase [Tissierellia bacterium]|nr:amidohydrolase [Tissierellia bacterium]
MEKLAKTIEDKLIEDYKTLHQIPEIELDLPKTFEYIKKRLDGLGVKYETGIGVEHSILAEIEGDLPGETTAIRADMDGLKIGEKTGLPYASTNGNMHACGHDGHVAMALGTAEILSKNKDRLKGKVKFIFQPGEEGGHGGKPMVEAGILDGVDRVLAIHAGSLADEGEVGDIFFIKGPMMASMDAFEIKVIGDGAHGAMPHTGIDPISITASIIEESQKIVAREKNPVDAGVISYGVVKGGRAFNIITQFVEVEGTIRALEHDTRDFLKERLKEVVVSTARAMRGSAEIIIHDTCPPLINDNRVVEEVYQKSRAIFGESVKYMKKPVMSSEDFAFFVNKLPGAMIFLNNAKEIDGAFHPHHNHKFAIDENLLYKGVAVFLAAVLD